MSDSRKEFEALPEISSCKNEIKFNDGENAYDCFDREIDCYVNGAWMAFQEQQKKIDEAIAALERSKPLMMCQVDAIEALNILKGE